MRVFAIVAAALVATVQAVDITITTPSSSRWWVADSVNNIEWSCGSGNPTSYTVMVANPDPKLLTAPLAIVGVLNDYICSFSFTPGTELQVGTGYILSLTNPINNTQIYSSSSAFEIKPKGSTYPPQTTPGAGGSGSGPASGSGSPSASGSGSGAAASPTPTKNGAIRNGASAVLALAGLALGITIA